MGAHLDGVDRNAGAQNRPSCGGSASWCVWWLAGRYLMRRWSAQRRRAILAQMSSRTDFAPDVGPELKRGRTEDCAGQ